MIGKHDLQINDGPALLSLEALQQGGRWHHRTRNNRREVQSRAFPVHGASTAKACCISYRAVVTCSIFACCLP